MVSGQGAGNGLLADLYPVIPQSNTLACRQVRHALTCFWSSSGQAASPSITSAFIFRYRVDVKWI
jgi:hypothetical protein